MFSPSLSGDPRPSETPIAPAGTGVRGQPGSNVCSAPHHLNHATGVRQRQNRHHGRSCAVSMDPTTWSQIQSSAVVASTPAECRLIATRPRPVGSYNKNSFVNHDTTNVTVTGSNGSS